MDAFARNGYIVFKSDYRGHGSSEGQPGGAYSRPDYTVDVLNALASIRRFPGADPNRIGMWGHSMGGYITLRAMVISRDIKAGVIWGGVVASYPDMITRWRATPPATLSAGARDWRSSFIEQYGTFEENPQFWASISANSYLADLSGPLQFHHGEADEERVRWSFPRCFTSRRWTPVRRSSSTPILARTITFPSPSRSPCSARSNSLTVTSRVQ